MCDGDSKPFKPLNLSVQWDKLKNVYTNCSHIFTVIKHRESQRYVKIFFGTSIIVSNFFINQNLYLKTTTSGKIFFGIQKVIWGFEKQSTLDFDRPL